MIIIGPVASAVFFYERYRPTDANYTARNAFQVNLNLLLLSLPSTAGTAGFYNDMVGQSPNQVYGLSVCRGDALPNDWQSCLNAASNITQKCPGGKSSTIWYDFCLLRYSSTNVFSQADQGRLKIWDRQPGAAQAYRGS
ncbi:cysteine-rich repeat secretory protein 38-like [Curcuma longa]|uniref:cysteine-rich repeat secretory protein 38-like n=1 Tax=Curcuma longa TaxID=136217 RepID=UPI003D9F7806